MTAAARYRKLKQLFPDPQASEEAASAYDLDLRRRTLNFVNLYKSAMQIAANRQASPDEQIVQVGQPTPTKRKKKER
jgi:hypothetical protein